MTHVPEDTHVNIQKFRGPRGLKGEDAVVDYAKVIREVLAQIRVPEDGKDGRTPEIDYDRIFAYIDKQIAKIPRPKDGKNGVDGMSPKVDYDAIYKNIEQQIARLPKPKDGERGEKGDPGKDGKSVGYVTEIVYRYIKESDIENLRQQLLDTFGEKVADEMIRNIEPTPLEHLSDDVLRELARRRGILQ
jgi:hypothetical protein